MARQAHIIGSCEDVTGVGWDVHESRPTEHGFPVLIGWPKGEPRGRGGRGVAAILTEPLCKYLLAVRRPRDIRLPIGKTAIKRLRSLIGLKWSFAEWWKEREGDLLSLTLEEFCRKHGGGQGAASTQRNLARKRRRKG